MVLKQNTVLELVDFSLIPFKTYMVLKLPGVDCQSKLVLPHFLVICIGLVHQFCRQEHLATTPVHRLFHSLHLTVRSFHKTIT